MSDTTGWIEYASNDLEQPADRFLRRVVAWAAILRGAQSVIGAALHLALAKHWVAAPSGMAWMTGEGWAGALIVVEVLTKCALAMGGVLMLRRSRISVVLVRDSVAIEIVLMLIGLVMAMRINSYASIWDTPAGAASYILSFLSGLWLPLLILFLTLPPLARRMM